MIKIIKEHACESVFEEFNSVIKEILDIINREKPVKTYGKEYMAIREEKNDYQDLLNVLSNLLEEKTNIKDVLKDKKYSLDELNVKNAIEGLNENELFKCEQSLYKNGNELCKGESRLYKNEHELYKKFLYSLNKEFRGRSSNFTFIIPMNLVFGAEKYEDDLKFVLSLFQMEKYDPESLQNLIKGEGELKFDDGTKLTDIDEISRLLEDFSQVLKVDVKARDRNYAYERAVFRVESFLGYVSFIDKKFSEKSYFKDFNLNRLDYGVLLILKDGKISWPPKGRGKTVKERIGICKEAIGEKTLESMAETAENHIQSIKSEGLRNMLCRSFALYYSACRERELDYSFLKFWILSEQMLKAPSAKTDEEILRIMKAFVNEHLSKRIDFLYHKRNCLVHKGAMGKISFNDRNLSKRVADILLLDALTKMKKLENKEQYDYYLLNLSTKKRGRYDQTRILDLFKKGEL